MTIYILRRYDGTFLQYGFDWTADMQEAYIYTALGPARSRVTKWKKRYPDEPALTILAFTFHETQAQVIDDSARLAKTIQMHARHQLEAQQRRNQDEIDRLRRQRIEIDSKLSTLGAISP